MKNLHKSSKAAVTMKTFTETYEQRPCEASFRRRCTVRHNSKLVRNVEIGLEILFSGFVRHFGFESRN